MRKLLILAAVAIVAPAGIGCQCGPVRNWLCRGYEARCNNQCVETCDPCGNQCVAGPSFGEMVPSTLPAGTTYIPGPVTQ